MLACVRSCRRALGEACPTLVGSGIDACWGHAARSDGSAMQPSQSQHRNWGARTRGGRQRVTGGLATHRDEDETRCREGVESRGPNMTEVALPNPASLSTRSRPSLGRHHRVTRPSLGPRRCGLHFRSWRRIRRTRLLDPKSSPPWSCSPPMKLSAPCGSPHSTQVRKATVRM